MKMLSMGLLSGFDKMRRRIALSRIV